MDRVTRRSFLVKGSIGAAGAAAGVAAGRAFHDDGSSAEAALSAAELERAGDQPVLLNVLDARTGEVELYMGEQEVVLTDRSLVAHVLRASQRGRA